MTNFRIKFINDGVNFCVDHWEHLTGWEQGFIGHVQNVPAERWTDNQFRTIQKIVPAVKQKVLSSQ